MNFSRDSIENFFRNFFSEFFSENHAGTPSETHPIILSVVQRGISEEITLGLQIENLSGYGWMHFLRNIQKYFLGTSTGFFWETSQVFLLEISTEPNLGVFPREIPSKICPRTAPGYFQYIF